MISLAPSHTTWLIIRIFQPSEHCHQHHKAEFQIKIEILTSEFLCEDGLSCTTIVFSGIAGLFVSSPSVVFPLPSVFPLFRQLSSTSLVIRTLSRRLTSPLELSVSVSVCFGTDFAFPCCRVRASSSCAFSLRLYMPNLQGDSSRDKSGWSLRNWSPCNRKASVSHGWFHVAKKCWEKEREKEVLFHWGRVSQDYVKFRLRERWSDKTQRMKDLARKFYHEVWYSLSSLSMT